MNARATGKTKWISSQRKDTEADLAAGALSLDGILQKGAALPAQQTKWMTLWWPSPPLEQELKLPVRTLRREAKRALRYAQLEPDCEFYTRRRDHATSRSRAVEAGEA